MMQMGGRPNHPTTDTVEPVEIVALGPPLDFPAISLFLWKAFAVTALSTADRMLR